MRLWFFSAKPHRAGPGHHRSPCIRPQLEALEDHCLLSASMMPMNQPMSAAVPMTSANTIASLPHDQIHVIQDQLHQQAQIAAIRLEVEQIALGLLQQFAPQTPQFQSLIAGLTSAIPMQQTTAQTLQNQSNLLDQLDDLQDQGLMFNAAIQFDSALAPLLQQFGNPQAANVLKNTIAADQAAMQALQPQIEAIEAEVSTFV